MKKAAVVGIGRLGLCFALNLEQSGYEVYGIDNDQNYLKSIAEKTIISNEPSLKEYLNKAKKLHVTNDLRVIEEEDIDLIFILVPTPSIPDGKFSHTTIDQVAEKLVELNNSKKQKHLVIGSTTMPGYTDLLAVKMKKSGYSVTYNPEFIAQGSILYDQQYPDQILIGEGHPEATQMLKEIYGRMCKSNPRIEVMTRKSAEICKLATNCFLTMKISFANAIGDLATTAGGESDKILAAIGADSRIGEKYLKYGFGFGGPCFPRDNHALIAFSQQEGLPLHLSEATIQVNKEHLEYQFNNLLLENKNEYIFDYITYKKGTDILEASQQLELALKLAKAGKKVVVLNSKDLQESLEMKYPSYFEFR